MDPTRVHAYLQAACAGLGFDIGEVWFSANQTGTSTVAAIEQIRKDEGGENVTRNIKFLQLYTSKSYKNRRNDLLRPASEDSRIVDNNNAQEDLEKHVLSPKLVNAISSTAQVVWANCDESQGLLGRSDMRLQTAVGMPVAMDSEGNMCIVVMFSPRNVKNSIDAMEYLKSLSQGAASTKIPCLLPVVDTNQSKLEYNAKRFSEWQKPCGGKGYLSITDCSRDIAAFRNESSTKEEDTNGVSYDMTAAPKDMYGIPMLPSLFDTSVDPQDRISSPSTDDIADAFDPTTYNIWNTIMQSGVTETNPHLLNIPNQTHFQGPTKDGANSMGTNSTNSSTSTLDLQTATPYLDPDRKERLEEFAQAFLTMSVFEVADIWVPSPGDGKNIHHISSVLSDDDSCDNYSLDYFCQVSQNVVLQSWSGAVGRAYSSGNSIWSTNKNLIFDDVRLKGFETAGISTAMAVPIFSNPNKSPRCVLCCYARVKFDSVSFVQKFVQHALRILWLGLDNMKPQESREKTLWNDVAPADLGEMAADYEMQNAFHKKKRPIQDISGEEKYEPLSNGNNEDSRFRSSSFSIQLQSLTAPFSSIDVTNSPSQPDQVVSALAPPPKFPSVATSLSSPVTNQPIVTQQNAILSLQNHLQQAVQSVAEAQPWPSNKRAHIENLQNNNNITTHQQRPYRYNQIATSEDNQVQVQYETPQTLGNGGTNHVPIDQTSSAAVSTQIPEVSVPQGPLHFQNESNGSSVFKEDPDVARQNIDSFNALVKMNVPNSNQSVRQNQAHEPLYSNNCIDIMSPPSVSYHIQPETKTEVTVNIGDMIPDAVTSSAPAASMYCMPVIPDPTQVVTLAQSSTSTVSGKPCRIQGCNELSISRRPYCARHSGNRSCEYPGCKKCAQGATRFCIAHGGGRRCTFPGCDKGARDKFFCAAHGGGKRCIMEGCKKSAVGGSNKCTSHGGGRRCAVENCNKSAQSSTKFCVKHGGGKKCAYNGCTKVARGRTLFCAGHGGGVRCKLEGCTRIAIGKLQLCRSHGGGSSRKQKVTSAKIQGPEYATVLMNQVNADVGKCSMSTSAIL